ncbi:hypothetical protein [Nocardia sp. BMG51109]|uniref:hypothetical protein n=1 Tax=Nocardia sp. BMG51109 TaxID=1056816 RepID=UPI0012EC3D02|nr:hypothetical protein [Nocardia sp. BMG51109]
MDTIAYKHPKCYANVDGGCSTKISGEHYISHGLIKLYTFGDPNVSIAHDNGYGIPQPVQPRRFVANVLCTAHNNGLSDLDSAAIDLATFLHTIALALRGGTGDWGADEIVQISGDNFQRWGLKLLLTHAAVNAFTGNGSRVVSPIPEDAVRLLLGKKPWPTNGGLCVAAHPNHAYLKFDPITTIEAVIEKWCGATPFLSHVDNSLCGGIVDLAGISFGLSLDERTRSYPALLYSDNPLRQTLRQPGYMAWRCGGAEKRIEFSWSDGNEHEGITYTLLR